MQLVSIIFASSGVIFGATLGVAIVLFAFWLFLNRDKEMPQAPLEDMDSLADALQESSTEFDLLDFPDFLRQVAHHISKGLGEQEIAKLVSSADHLPHEREAQFEFQVVFNGTATPLQARFFKDDVSSIAVYFFASKPLMKLLDQEMESFFAERGM